jgi:hypothetical protein
VAVEGAVVVAELALPQARANMRRTGRERFMGLSMI